MTMTWTFLRQDLARVIPISFLVGAGMEFFMIKTGFYEIVTRKEGERRAEKIAIEEERRKRIAQLKIDSKEA